MPYHARFPCLARCAEIAMTPPFFLSPQTSPSSFLSASQGSLFGPRIRCHFKSFASGDQKTVPAPSPRDFSSRLLHQPPQALLSRAPYGAAPSQTRAGLPGVGGGSRGPRAWAASGAGEHRGSGEHQEMVGPTESWPVPRLRRKEVLVGARRLVLIQPADEDEVLDMYIARGEKERDPYWCTLWPAAVALFQFVVGHPEIVRGKRVCDLGAGLGLAGVAAMLAGAKEVVLLDREPLSLLCALLTAHANAEGPLASNLEEVLSSCGLSVLLQEPSIWPAFQGAEPGALRSHIIAGVAMSHLVQGSPEVLPAPAPAAAEPALGGIPGSASAFSLLSSGSPAPSSLPSSTAPSISTSSSASSLTDLDPDSRAKAEGGSPDAQDGVGGAQAWDSKAPSAAEAEDDEDTGEEENEEEPEQAPETEQPLQYHSSLLVYTPGDAAAALGESPGGSQGDSERQEGRQGQAGQGSFQAGRAPEWADVRSVLAQEFDWSRGPLPGPFDVVLASDILYEESAAPFLAELLPSLVTREPALGEAAQQAEDMLRQALGNAEAVQPCVVISDPTERCPAHRRHFLQLLRGAKLEEDSSHGFKLALLGQGTYRVSWREEATFRKSYIECMSFAQET